MMQYRSKLHPSSCFPPEPSIPTIRNRLFIRIAPNQTRQQHQPRLTFIGINKTTYSAIAALLSSRPSTSIECINLFDLDEKVETRATLNDLQLIGIFNRLNVRLVRAQSYWETKDSTIIIINVQHHRLETESISTWIQINATLVEAVVSHVCTYSPNATLIVCTQPNELMTYVASRVSQFPTERVVGLGASVHTAYAHRIILDQNEKIRGHVNGFFILGNGTLDQQCATVLSDHLTINGICCSDISSNDTINPVEKSTMENPVLSRTENINEWNLIKILENNGTLYSNSRRRLPIVTDLIFRHRTAMKYLLPNSIIPRSEPKSSESIKIPCNTKSRSNWTEAMLIVHITRALLNNCEFQSNFTVNIAPIHYSKDVFITYPTILGSSNRSIEYMFPFHHAQTILQQDRLLLIAYEKLQNNIRLSKSKD